MRCGAGLCLLWCAALRLWALEPPDGEAWKTVRTEANRFVVHGLDAGGAQGIAIWVEQTLLRLGRDFGVDPRFDRFRPVVIVRHPGFAEHRLAQQGRGRGLTQEIRAPEGGNFDALLFAEQVLTAMLHRFAEQRTDAGERVAKSPGWLARGWAADFVPEERGAVLARGLERWREGRLNPPYTITTVSSPAGAPPEDETWAVQYLLSHRSERGRIFDELAATGGFSLESWMRITGTASVRELHIAWALWMTERERRFLADPLAETWFRAQLERERVFTAARFGFDGEEVPRDQPFTLLDLAERLEEPWVVPLIQAWRRRMVFLRFGQRAERLQQMDLHIASAEALLEAAGRRGARRGTALARFHLLYEAAHDPE